MVKADSAEEIDGIAWNFLCSSFSRPQSWGWPLEGRIDAFLRHLKRLDILNDGTAYGTLLDRVMANFPRARRDGVLDEPHR